MSGLIRLAVVIPMYNEEMNAEKCVRSMLREIGNQLENVSLFAVNDGSLDKTKLILEGLKREELPFEFVNQEENSGYGGACLAGALCALEKGYDFALFMDSDLTNDPKLIPKFYEVLATNKYDIVKASRYISGGGMSGVPMYRQAITRYGNMIASLFFGMRIRDCTNGFRAVRLSFLVGAKFKERGFPMILEELLWFKMKGARAAEIPYILTSRAGDGGVSKFNYTPKVFWSYLKYALKAFMGVR